MHAVLRQQLRKNARSIYINIPLEYLNKKYTDTNVQEVQEVHDESPVFWNDEK